MHRAIRLSLISVLISACQVDRRVPQDAKVACSEGSPVCPTGWRCAPELGLCVQGNVTTDPPTIEGIPTVNQSPARSGQVITITFSVIGDLGLPPEVSVQWPGQERAATAADVRGAEYDYTLVPDAELDPEGSATVRIDLVGDNGLPGGGTFPGLVTFDFTDPAPLESTVTRVLEPTAENPLRNDPDRQVDGAAHGTTVRIFFAVNEILAEDPIVRLQSLPEILFTRQGSPTGTFYTYAYTVSDSEVGEGDLGIEVELVDVAGNRAVVALNDADGALQFRTDFTAPVSPSVNVADGIVYWRMPWGAQASSGVPEFSVIGAAQSVEPDATVIAFDGPDPTVASEIGRVAAASDGSIGVSSSILELSRADRGEVYLASIDGAGNQSALVRIRDVVWVASMGNKISGSTTDNPHRLGELRQVTETRVPQSFRELNDVELALVQLEDGSSVSVSSLRHWFLPSTDTPQLSFSAPVYDHRNSEVFLFGQVGLGGGVNELWAYRDTGWQRRSFSGLGPAVLPDATVYDTLRDRVLVIGADTDGLDDFEVWEWDGRNWLKPAIEAGFEAPGRAFGTAGYHAKSGRLVQLGGFTDEVDCPGALAPAAAPLCIHGDARAWKDGRWEDISPDPSIPPRAHGAAAYDAARDVLVVFGGCLGYFFKGCDLEYDDLWEWDGSTWREIPKTGPWPLGRWSHGMVYDPDRGGIVIFGGRNPGCTNFVCDDSWLWDGMTWQPIPTTGGPPNGAFAAMTYDPNQKRVLLWPLSVSCGVDDESCGEFWELRDTHWSKLSHAANATPMAFATTVTDTARNVLVRFGGCDNVNASCTSIASGHSNETWEWNGYVWSPRCEDPNPTDPDHCPVSPPCSGHPRLRFRHRQQADPDFRRE